MKSGIRVTALTALLVVFVATGCGSTATTFQSPHPAGGGPLRLPAPTALQPREAAFTLAEGYLDGADYDALKPNNRASAVGSTAAFVPDFTGASGDSSAGLAYVIYDFHLPNYGGSLADIAFDWTDHPAAGSWFVGLANFSSDRWNWQSDPAADTLHFPQIAQYLNPADHLYLAVATTGTSASILASIQISEQQAPVAGLIADVDSGVAPLTVNFDATGSTDADGTITGYEWDFNGDDNFTQAVEEVAGFGDPTPPAVTYDVVGVYDVQVRVTDNDGKTDLMQLQINVTASQPPVAGLASNVQAGPKPLGVDFDATSSMDPDGTVDDYEWDFDGDGNFSEVGAEQAAHGDATPPTFSYTIVGATDAAVRVTDNDGGSDVQTLQITVSNTPPTAGLTADVMAMDAPLLTTFFADTSSDAGGSIVDYEWDFDGDGVFNEAATNEATERGNAITAPQTYTNPGVYTVSVRVTDDDGATDETSIDVTAHGWRLVTVDDPPTAAAVVSQQFALVNGKPAIAAFTLTPNELHYSLSTTNLGQESADWTTVTVPSGGTGTQEIAICAIAGGPAIAQRDMTNNRLVYFYANGDGSSVAHWNGPVVVDATAGAGRQPQMALVNGNPAIYFGQDSTSDVRYRRSTTATGALSGDWGSSVDIETAGTNVTNNHTLAVVNGNPAVVYYNFVNPNDFLKYARSTDADGDAGADWSTKFSLDSSNGSGAWVNYGLIEVGGFPATMFVDDANLIYKRGTNAAGSAWAADVNVAGAGTVGTYGKLALIDGNPAFAYMTQANSPRYRRSTTATGNSAGDWATVETIDSSGAVCLNIKLLEVDGKPAVCYSNATTSATIYAIRL